MGRTDACSPGSPERRARDRHGRALTLLSSPRGSCSYEMCRLYRSRGLGARRPGNRRGLSNMAGFMIAVLIGRPGPDGKPGDGAEAARQLAQSSCVQVVNAAKNNRGSGVVIGVRGAFLYVLTASHVVSGSDRL